MQRLAKGEEDCNSTLNSKDVSQSHEKALKVTVKSLESHPASVGTRVHNDRYACSYRSNPMFVTVVTRRQTSLFGQLNGLYEMTKRTHKPHAPLSEAIHSCPIQMPPAASRCPQ